MRALNYGRSFLPRCNWRSFKLIVVAFRPAPVRGSEIGVYDDDPFGDLGRLQAELHRAVRLVTDTGMHAKKWSREQAINYMVTTEGLNEATATSEIERYVVWPAQALGYKLGQLKILALREEAKQTLGDAFDIRDFNQQVLDVASAPLPFIELTVRNWIAETAEP